MLEMNSVAAHRWQIAWHINLNANVPCRTVGACEHYNFIHQFTQHQRVRIELSPLEQRAQPIDDFTGALVILADICDNGAYLLEVRLIGLEKKFRRLGIAQNGSRAADLIRGPERTPVDPAS